MPATAITRAIGLARGIVLARLISETEYGLFQITLLVINLLNPLCALGLNEGIARYVPMYETRGTLRRYLRQVAPIITGIALAACALVFAAAQPLGRLIYATVGTGTSLTHAPSITSADVHVWTQLTRLAAGTAFGMVVYFLLLSVLKGLRMFRAVSLMELANNVLFTGLTVGLALGGRQTALVMTACFALALFLMVPLFAIPLRRHITDHPAPAMLSPDARDGPTDASSTMGQLLRYSTWAAASAVIWQALQYYPMWYLQKTHGAEVTAIFAAVRLVTQVVAIGAVTIVAVVQTSVTKTWETQGPGPADRRLGVAYKCTSLVMLATCILFAAAAEPIMRMFPLSYRAGVRIVPLGLMFFLISGHLTFLAVHFTLIEKMRQLFWPWIVGLLANALLSVMLVSPGMTADRAIHGAAWAGTGGLTVALGLALILLRRERRPIDAGTVILCAAIYLLALPLWAQLVGTGALLCLLIGSGWVLTKAEKAQLRELIRRNWSRLRSLRRPPVV